ncbi:MAG: S8 family serine peptidase [Gemmatimonadetes bacterium]|nr:S8 family serine peptidase [Gemmatimonadota bacterium]
MSGAGVDRPASAASAGAASGETLVHPSHSALAARGGRGVRVAVIDSGIHAGHPHVGGLAGAVAFDDRGRIADDVVDRLGHGTAVAAAIHEKAPEAELHVAKVFDATLSTTVLALKRALEWAGESGARLVNLSLGTPRAEHEGVLAPVVAELASGGCLVVSARHDQGRTWWPGSLPAAVGVTLDWETPRDGVVVEPFEEGLRLRASGYPRPIPGVHPDRNLRGVSFAVANATGVLARALEGRDGIRSAGALAALLLDAQFLESGKVELDVPVLGHVKATSALPFDIGVVLVVVGLVLVVLETLGAEAEEGTR